MYSKEVANFLLPCGAVACDCPVLGYFVSGPAGSVSQETQRLHEDCTGSVASLHFLENLGPVYVAGTPVVQQCSYAGITLQYRHSLQ